MPDPALFDDPAADTDASAPREAVPRHVAIIMDGNRRWARERGASEAIGHAEGLKRVRPIVEHSAVRGLESLSLYAFSRENWRRAQAEVDHIMELLGEAIRDEVPDLVKQSVRLRFVGRRQELTPEVLEQITSAEEATSGGTRMILNVAFNYSGREEIIDAFRACLAAGFAPADIDERLVSRHVYTAGQADPDLVIRTGGDQRVSNFLLWQAAYAEFYTTETLWPDFYPESLDQAIEEYQRRARRFGR
jgi:undecaprenyl diphosphate synthase